MADSNDNVLDKAETVARRILERLGSKVDNKLSPADEQTLTPRVIADLASRVEQVIESNLEKDEQGVNRIAPNRFRVLFTYEETSKLSPQYIEAVGKELTETVREYTNNRRYSTRGPISVEVGRDLFAKAILVKASFDRAVDQKTEHPRSEPAGETLKRISFQTSDGRSYRVELKPEGAPAYIGRAAGNAVRIDDPSVSRLHCSLSVRAGGKVLIADVGSINGTLVNGALLGRDEARALSDGDVLGIGDFKLTVTEIH
jgi:septum formation topological specificity factor MinE